MDLRPGSKTYGKWYGLELSAENKIQFYVSEGFAHGFLVLSDVAEFCYKVTDFYHPGDEGGLARNDPAIGIEWPELVGTYCGNASAQGYTLADGTPLILSDKDQKSTAIGHGERAELKKLGCHVISNYSICWGGVNHLYAVLDLMRLAVENEYEYYHLISGEDLLVNSYEQVRERFSGNDKIYISCHDAVNDPMWNIRYRYWYIFKNRDTRARFYRQMNQLSLGLQKLFGVRRRSIGAEENICKGYLYGDFPHDAVQYVLRYKVNHQVSGTLISTAKDHYDTN